jgi:hypothetical protein
MTKKSPPEVPEEQQQKNAYNDKSNNAEEPLKEIGGPAGLEPTRYGDWEKNGRCSDF